MLENLKLESEKQMSSMRNIKKASLDGYEVFLMDNKEIIIIDGIKNGKSHISWETITIDAAEKLAGDLLNAVFDATEKVKIDYAAYDEKKWQEIKAVARSYFYDFAYNKLFNCEKKILDKLKVSDCDHFQNLYLFTEDRELSIALKNNEGFSATLMSFLMDCGNRPPADYSIVSVSIDHCYGSVSL